LKELKKYNIEYSLIISKIYKSFNGKFSALASPTLSKQETVTGLYEKIVTKESKFQSVQVLAVSLCQFIPRLIYITVNLIWFSKQNPTPEIPKGCIFIRTWLVPKSVLGMAIVDDYFRSLHEELWKTEAVVSLFMPLDYSIVKSFTKYKAKNQILAISFLSIVDIIKTVASYICEALIQVHRSYIYEGEDISPNINRSLLLDYLRLRSFQAYLEKSICEKLIAYKIKTFIYVYENQAWEKSCCMVLKKSGTRVIGYQSSGFSDVFLNFFPNKLDSEIHPMPDIILTVGDYFTKYLKDNGCYRVPIRTFSALRFPHPRNGERYVVAKPNLKIHKKILYALPVQKDQYKFIIDTLVKEFGNSKIFIDIKPHPALKKEISRLQKLMPKNFSIVLDVDFENIANEYDFIFFNDNSYGIEALFYGVKSFQLLGKEVINQNRFFYFNLWNPNIYASDLKSFREKLFNGDCDKSFDSKKVEDYLNNLYEPYTEDKHKFLLEVVNNRVILEI